MDRSQLYKTKEYFAFSFPISTIPFLLFRPFPFSILHSLLDIRHWTLDIYPPLADWIFLHPSSLACHGEALRRSRVLRLLSSVLCLPSFVSRPSSACHGATGCFVGRTRPLAEFTKFSPSSCSLSPSAPPPLSRIPALHPSCCLSSPASADTRSPLRPPRPCDDTPPL